jgi:hypothetical protein
MLAEAEIEVHIRNDLAPEVAVLRELRSAFTEAFPACTLVVNPESSDPPLIASESRPRRGSFELRVRLEKEEYFYDVYSKVKERKLLPAAKLIGRIQNLIDRQHERCGSAIGGRENEGMTKNWCGGHSEKVLSAICLSSGGKERRGLLIHYKIFCVGSRTFNLCC